MVRGAIVQSDMHSRFLLFVEPDLAPGENGSASSSLTTNTPADKVSTRTIRISNQDPSKFEQIRFFSGQLLVGFKTDGEHVDQYR